METLRSLHGKSNNLKNSLKKFRSIKKVLLPQILKLLKIIFKDVR